MEPNSPRAQDRFGKHQLEERLSISVSMTFVHARAGANPLTVGHLHTGGTSVKIYKNGQLLCNTLASYGGTPRYIERSNGMQGATGMKHISRMSGCSNLGRFEKGDIFYLTADYDFVNHPG
jgi:hypothetical protein